MNTKSVTSVGDWIQEKLKTKAGVFVLGLFIGTIPATSVSYVFYKDSELKDRRFMNEIKRIELVEAEKDEWQKKAFEAENTCIEKMRDMANFFQDLEVMYDEQDKTLRKQIDLDRDEILQYETTIRNINSN